MQEPFGPRGGYRGRRSTTQQRPVSAATSNGTAPKQRRAKHRPAAASCHASRPAVVLLPLLLAGRAAVGRAERTLHGGPPSADLMWRAPGVSAVAVAPDASFIVTGVADGTARVWDTATWQPVQTLQGHSGSVTAVAVAPDASFIVTGSWDDTARVWECLGRGTLNACESVTCHDNVSCNCNNGFAGSGCQFSDAGTCGGAGSVRVDDTGNPKCKCDAGVQGDFCQSAAAEKEEANRYKPFYYAAGAISAVTFGAALYASGINPVLALFATLRVWDTMSDWAMYAISFQSDRFTKTSKVGSDGDNTYEQVQKASLAFTIIGSVLLVLDMSTLLRRFSDSDSSSSASIGFGMLTIILLEDIPQLVLSSVYIDTVEAFEGLSGDDTLAVLSLVMSVLSMVFNGALACSFITGNSDETSA